MYERDAPVGMVYEDSCGELTWRTSAVRWVDSFGFRFEETELTERPMGRIIADPRASDALRMLGWSGDGDPREWAKSVTVPTGDVIYRATGKVDATDIPSGADVGTVEIGEDAGDWVRLIVSRADAHRLAAQWRHDLEVIVRRRHDADGE